MYVNKISNKTSKEVTTGSDRAPMQRAKQTSGSGLSRLNIDFTLSSAGFFLKAVEIMVSSQRPFRGVWKQKIEYSMVFALMMCPPILYADL
jgi:hypothetical protein